MLCYIISAVNMSRTRPKPRVSQHDLMRLKCMSGGAALLSSEGKSTKSREHRARTQVPPHVQKLHVYGSGTFGAFWLMRLKCTIVYI